MRKILVNKIRCKKCGDVIESKSVHDFKFSVAVDGVHDYFKTCGSIGRLGRFEYQKHVGIVRNNNKTLCLIKLTKRHNLFNILNIRGDKHE